MTNAPYSGAARPIRVTVDRKCLVGRGRREGMHIFTRVQINPSINRRFVLDVYKKPRDMKCVHASMRTVGDVEDFRKNVQINNIPGVDCPLQKQFSSY